MPHNFLLKIIIEGDSNKVLELKEQITDQNGELNPFKLFQDIHTDPSIPESLFRRSRVVENENTETDHKLFCYESFRSFWGQSINGNCLQNCSKLFQLTFEYSSDEMNMSEWYGISLKFPKLTFLISFSHWNNIYCGHILMIQNRVYRTISHQYYRDRDGYSMFLNGDLNWTYVLPIELRLREVERIAVLKEKIPPLKEQLGEVEKPIEFFSEFPLETFPCWLIEDEHYFEPRPNTVFYPYPEKTEELDAADFSM